MLRVLTYYPAMTRDLFLWLAILASGGEYSVITRDQNLAS